MHRQRERERYSHRKHTKATMVEEINPVRESSFNMTRRGGGGEDIEGGGGSENV